jgi:hypothetical protein
MLPNVQGCIQKFRDWSPGARTVNGTAATRCSCIAILWVSLVSFATITLCVASQRVFILYFVIDSVRELLCAPTYTRMTPYFILELRQRIYEKLGYGLGDQSSRVRFPAGAENFPLHHRVQNGSGAHPASYSMGTRGCSPGGKAALAWSWPLTSV